MGCGGGAGSFCSSYTCNLKRLKFHIIFKMANPLTNGLRYLNAVNLFRFLSYFDPVYIICIVCQDTLFATLALSFDK